MNVGNVDEECPVLLPICSFGPYGILISLVPFVYFPHFARHLRLHPTILFCFIYIHIHTISSFLINYAAIYEGSKV